MEQLSITPTPWKLSQSPVMISSFSKRKYKSVKNQSSIGGKIIANAWGDSDKESDDNAKAIVSAINNTYGQNINPEAVPELFEALKGMIEPFSHIGGVGYDAKLKAMTAAKAAIEKAQL